MATGQYNGPFDMAEIACTTTPAALLPTTGPSVYREGVYFQPDGGTVYIGGPNVTSSTGIKLGPDQLFFVETRQGSGWYGVTASGTVNCRVVPVL